MPEDIQVYGWINTLKGAAITIDIYETQLYCDRLTHGPGEDKHQRQKMEEVPELNWELL